jgi:hypothetical protein
VADKLLAIRHLTAVEPQWLSPVSAWQQLHWELPHPKSPYKSHTQSQKLL